MTEIIGLPLDQALSALKARGVPDVCIVESKAPRGARNTGALRVTCVRDGGKTLIVSRFLDRVDGAENLCQTI